MNASAKLSSNVKQVVPFFRVSNMDRSLRFYLDGLGFALKNKWVVDEKIRWCWLELGGAITLSLSAANSAKGSHSNFSASTPWLSTASLFRAV